MNFYFIKAFHQSLIDTKISKTNSSTSKKYAKNTNNSRSE